MRPPSEKLVLHHQHARLQDVLRVDGHALVVAHGHHGRGAQPDADVLVLQRAAVDDAVQRLVGLGREPDADVVPDELERQARLEELGRHVPGLRRDGVEVVEGLVPDVGRLALGQEGRDHGLQVLMVLRELEVPESGRLFALGYLGHQLGPAVDDLLAVVRLGSCIAICQWVSLERERLIVTHDQWSSGSSPHRCRPRIPSSLRSCT